MQKNKLILRSTLFLVIASIFWQSCSHKTPDTYLTIEDSIHLDSVPSGSGMALIDVYTYIISDDGTSIYQINVNDTSQYKIHLKGLPDTLYREPKSIKHDYEAAALTDWNGTISLLAFGSGSNLETRDSLLILSLTDHRDQQTLSLTDFYTRLMQITQTDSKQWNIEGAAVINNQLYLCNRGNNLLIEISLDDFKKYIQEPGSPFPHITWHRVHLPAIEKKEARLSGACKLNNSSLFFSASVEDTPDWTKDGPILGSFFIEYSLTEKKVVNVYPLMDKNNIHLLEKIEAVEIADSKDDSNLSLIAVSDNDDGTSKLFRLRIKNR